MTDSAVSLSVLTVLCHCRVSSGDCDGAVLLSVVVTDSAVLLSVVLTDRAVLLSVVVTESAVGTMVTDSAVSFSVVVTQCHCQSVVVTVSQ